ncbi:TPA: PBECR2 nuclease fold domain-containing protein [Vibrio parahaemolyticus]|uniref:PBECR2 nuclease fold domain-containing protein n=1 Tax=Vibrio TaxID=662 RepID=UPI001021D2EF|nr:MULTISPECIES: PBECR2 nuclease fold domain-containing protein [Vibrio]MCA3966638.1 hypothetical protein [Vibrio vulnificus]TOK03238.1 hypothetical protein CGI25_25290 [Vibrio parahaemolyticus]HCH1122259.1 hypothetical protein [Vibrio parahaemolyticus]HCH4062748.1 hypothetical protein [Vibrio parahaemolyticus]
MAREIKDQLKWVDLDLLDLRRLGVEHRLPCPGEILAAESKEAALLLLAEAFGCVDKAVVELTSKIGVLLVERNKLEHIIEKRQDARERYVRYALATLDEPYEVWKVAYDDDSWRYAFIGMFQTKRQMLVVVNIQKTDVLWNFMHCDAKSLNKHRHGELIYQRNL